jgi:penicillin-binding protein 1C
MNILIKMCFYVKKNAKKRKIIACMGIAMLIAYYFCLPRELFQVPYATVVEDRNGKLLGARIAQDGQWRFPPCNSVSPKYANCLIAYEDRRFYYHWGINPLSVVRAIAQNIKAKRVVRGGSTISMQVIRMMRNKKRNIIEKAKEAILATRLEFRYSKSEILALYASHAPFGGNVVGIDAAAWRYFGHNSEQLSYAEAATLAVLPNDPARLHIAKNHAKLLAKRNQLLKYLFDEGQISEMDYQLALDEKLPNEIVHLPNIAPHLISRFYSIKCGQKTISTIDKDLQVNVENLLRRWSREFSRSNIRNIAAIILDIKTMQILVYCGNVNFSDTIYAGQVDILRAERSTGSILKPFLYEAMLAEGKILPRSLQSDIPLNINGFSPENYNRHYEGAVPASEAISRSLNVPLVLMLQHYGVSKFHNYLKKNKIAKLPKAASHYGLSLILGGAEAQLGDVTTAYANMARCLQGLNATASSCILDEKPQLLDASFHAGSVWQVFDAIKEVNRPEEIDWHDISSMQQIAWKTGTSFGFRDAWAVGITPLYAVGVWVGNASGEGTAGLMGAKTAGPVLFDIFELLPYSPWFSLPQQAFTTAEVCRESGYLRGRYCENIDTVLILSQGERSPSCPFHQLVHLTTNEKFRISTEHVEDANIISKSWFVLPAAWAYYYKQYHPEYKILPPYQKGYGNETNSMQFIYPQTYSSTIKLPKQIDGHKGEIIFRLAHNRSNATVFWHIDGDYISSTTLIHTLNISLTQGEHSITAVDDEGNSISCKIKII